MFSANGRFQKNAFKENALASKKPLLHLVSRTLAHQMEQSGDTLRNDWPPKAPKEHPTDAKKRPVAVQADANDRKNNPKASV